MKARPSLGGESSRLCGVSGCSSLSRYECPRCNLPYCTASCYGAHSIACVEAFSNQTDIRLKGVKTSAWERRRFHDIVQRVRDAGFYGGSYEDPVIEDGHDEEEVVEELREEDQDDEEVDAEEVPGLLEKFMNSLDEDGKKLVFQMIRTGMEERYQETKPAAKEISSQDNDSNARGGDIKLSSERVPASEGETKKTNDSPPDVTETLEDLLHDMEVRHLSYEQILDRLPEGMARDFEAKLRDGRASRLLKLWRPWWIVHVDGEEVEVHGENDWEEEEGQLPPLPTSDKLLVPVQVPRKNGSTFIMHSVVDVLAAYCLSLRLCNGDWVAEPSHVARSMWELSPVLCEDRRYRSIDETCGWSFRTIVQADKSTEAAIEALYDVSAVLSGRSEWVARGLFESQRILEAALSETSSSGKKHIKARVRKIAYFVSWALCQDTQSFVSASRAVLAYVELERGRCGEVKVAERVIRLAKNSAKGGPRVTVVQQ